jgi:hypothetical protein
MHCRPTLTLRMAQKPEISVPFDSGTHSLYNRSIAKLLES